MTTHHVAPGTPPEEGFVDINGEGFYAIPNVDRLGPFLMSIVSDSDLWMFVSSRGGLTAGRGNAASALFPYETDDRLHQAAGITGPVTAFRLSDGTVWCPLAGPSAPDVARNLYKSVVGNQVIFEEAHGGLGLVFRYRWSNSDRFGFVRTASLTNAGDSPVDTGLIDGLVNLLPSGLDPALYQRLNNLTNAYKRSEIIDAGTRLAAFTLEAHIVDRPEPAEALVGSVAWSRGLEGATVTLDPAAVADFITGRLNAPQSLVTGRPGGYLLTGNVTIGPGEATTWHIVADVRQDQPAAAGLRRFLRSSPDPIAEVSASIRRGTEGFVHLMARSDALQRTGDRVATAHQFANVTYNAMRGGVFLYGYNDPHRRLCGLRRRPQPRRGGSTSGLARESSRVGRTRMAPPAKSSTAVMPNSFGSVSSTCPSPSHDATATRAGRGTRSPSRYGTPQATRPCTTKATGGTSSRTGKPCASASPPTCRVSSPSSSTPQPQTATTPTGSRGAESTGRCRTQTTRGATSDTGATTKSSICSAYSKKPTSSLRERSRISSIDPWFSYADVPYRIASHEELVRDPKDTITYDTAAADRSAERVSEIGADGKLMWDPDREVYLVSLLEKLLVPALAKLSNYVPDGGIWMNTQRPEWNDANNALVGHGLSMVTLYQLRRYLHFLRNLVDDAALSDIQLSTEVAGWLTRITAILRGHADRPDGGLNPRQRKTFMDELGRASFEYRSRVYAGGFSGSTQVGAAAIADLFEIALDHLDTDIRRSRRPDGLYHSYNLVEFGADGSEATISHLPEMLEGQVAVLSSGLLSAEERAEVVAGALRQRHVPVRPTQLHAVSGAAPPVVP